MPQIQLGLPWRPALGLRLSELVRKGQIGLEIA
jgi:hypothetical protein